jgi:cold shock CspA family protein
MSDSWQDSVVLIVSSDPNESHFGTGFVIGKHEQTTYLLTCAHVVRDVGGPDKIEINGSQARVIASSSENGADLAVLLIEKLLDVPLIPLLPLYSGSEKGKPFSTAGFQLDGKQYLIRTLHGTLGKQVGIQERGREDRIRAWDLEITDTYSLQPGYSGSPVVDEYNRVIGVVNTRRGEGKTGAAIFIEALEKIWTAHHPLESHIEHQHIYSLPEILPKGSVKWFNNAKGFGFLSGEDVFIDHTVIQTEGFGSLKEGQRVDFDVTKGPKGLQDASVRVRGFLTKLQIENRIAELSISLGAMVEREVRVGDRMFDLIVTPSLANGLTQTSVIEVNDKQVSEDAVQAFAAKMGLLQRRDQVYQWIIVSIVGRSSAASTKAKEVGIHLFTLEELETYLRNNY